MAVAVPVSTHLRLDERIRRARLKDDGLALKKEIAGKTTMPAAETDLNDRDLDEPPVPKTLFMTEEEFDRWHDEPWRGEWVDGKVEIMAPASNRHVQLVMFILRLLETFVEQFNLGEVRGPDLAVKLPGVRRRRLPDVAFVAKHREHIIRPTYIDGAPGLIMEIVSSESESRDWRTKHHEYERAGVVEYWIIDPGSEVVEANRLSANSRYELIPEVGGRIESQAVSGFFLKPAWLWQTPPPRLLELLRELAILPSESPGTPGSSSDGPPYSPEK
jgi:Uma2 family endonuclease